MANKKQSGDFADLVNPADLAADASATPTQPAETIAPSPWKLKNDRLARAANRASGGRVKTSYTGDFDNYDKYIDRPFSMNERNIDDTRAEGQSFGEKAFRSYGVKICKGSA